MPAPAVAAKAALLKKLAKSKTVRRVGLVIATMTFAGVLAPVFFLIVIIGSVVEASAEMCGQPAIDGAASAPPSVDLGNIEATGNFAEDLLDALGMPKTEDNIRFINAFARAEGAQPERHNPLNTSQPMPGATTFNGHGVKAYPDYETGLRATVITMTNGRYQPILDALAAGNSAERAARAVGQTPWDADGRVSGLILRVLGSSGDIEAPSFGGGGSSGADPVCDMAGFPGGAGGFAPVGAVNGSISDPGGPVGPSELATIQSATGEAVRVHRSAAGNFGQLFVAARQAGLPLSGWGWRDTERQKELRIINGCPDVYNAPSSACRVPTARPGSSMHERGLAVDFTCNGATIKSRSHRCFTWLAQNAPRFGFQNLPSEPWHWSTNGR